jgi:hypothetical protein
MSSQAVSGLNLFAHDASGQRRFSVSNFPKSAKVRDLITSLIPQMGLSANDTAGRPMDYQVFSRREHVHLRGSETVGEALQDGDSISLLPDVQAGMSREALQG